MLNNVITRILLSARCTRGHSIEIPCAVDPGKEGSLLINKDFIDDTIHEYCPVCRIVTAFIITDIKKYN